MAGGIDRPAWRPVPDIGPAVPVVSPGHGERQRREELPQRRRPRADEQPEPEPRTTTDDDGAGDEESHHVDVVV